MTVHEATKHPNAWPRAGATRAASRPTAIPFDWPLRESSRMVEAAGTRWHVQRVGTGPKLLLIHGTAASTHSWRELVPRLAGDYDVLAADLPGHGFSARLPDGSMTLPALAEGLADLLSALDYSPDYVVGHSAGAALALRMVLDAAIEPRVVVGINAALLPFGGPLRRLFAPMARMFANTHLMPALVARRAGDVRAVQRVLAGTGSELDAEGTSMYQRLLKRESHVAAVLAMMASWELAPLLDDLGRLRTPLHLVTSSGDRAVAPSQADTVAAMVPDATITKLDGPGHLAHEEQPEQFADVIKRLCRDDGEI